MKNIAVFASGSGSNAVELIRFFEIQSHARVALVVCNNPQAGVIEKCKKYKVHCQLINRNDVATPGFLLELLRQFSIDFIVLAGFLQKIPLDLVQAFPNRIINIHPALLPAYGGPGMYGARVHTAILQNAEKQSGITIHYVDEHYDNGDIIFQETVDVEPGDTIATLQQKIQVLEHKHLPEITNTLIKALPDEF